MKPTSSVTNGMTFGSAIEALKQGKKVARKGWNGKGMYLFLVVSYEVNQDLGEVWSNDRNSDVNPMLPWIAMRTVQNNIVPWLASQTDILAEDYCIVQ